MIRMRLGKLQDKFGLKPVVVVTEKVSSLLCRSEKCCLKLFSIVLGLFELTRYG